jgi:hypothetical protein
MKTTLLWISLALLQGKLAAQILGDGRQPETIGLEPGTWGSAAGYTTVAPMEFVGSNDVGVAFSPIYEYGSLVCTSDFDGEALAQVHLPEGAKLGFLTYWAYDDSDDDLKFDLIETCQSASDTDPTTTVLGGAFTIGRPGAVSFVGDLGDATVHNKDCAYVVKVTFGPGCDGNNLRVRKLRISWTRQVSPPPATATFNDVPTGHLFFQFVEALAKSGITGGCGGNNFCPDAPLTRGQMGVFLAKALGLQWP